MAEGGWGEGAGAGAWLGRGRASRTTTVLTLPNMLWMLPGRGGGQMGGRSV